MAVYLQLGKPYCLFRGILAEALRSVVEKLDPEGKDPALNKMVVIGHSQGGLLTRLMLPTAEQLFGTICPRCHLSNFRQHLRQKNA